jgi:hypothetical protein
MKASPKLCIHGLKHRNQCKSFIRETLIKGTVNNLDAVKWLWNKLIFSKTWKFNKENISFWKNWNNNLFKKKNFTTRSGERNSANKSWNKIDNWEKNNIRKKKIKSNWIKKSRNHNNYTTYKTKWRLLWIYKFKDYKNLSKSLTNNSINITIVLWKSNFFIKNYGRYVRSEW